MSTSQMKPMQFWIRAMLRAYLAFFWLHSLVAAESPVPIPNWAKPIENLLPKASQELVAQVEQLCNIVAESGAETVKMMPPESIEALRKLILLREKSGYALVWLYVKEPKVTLDVPATMSNDPSVLQGITDLKGEGRGKILHAVNDDPTLARWLLPAVRARLHWMEGEIIVGRTKQSLSHKELTATYSYLYTHGTWEDVEMLERILSETSKSGINIVDPLKPPELKDREATFLENHARVLRHGRPLWKEQAELLVGAKLLDESALSDARPQIQHAPDQKSQSRTSSQGETYPKMNQPSIESKAKSLAMVVLGIVTAVGLLWLVLKRRTSDR